MPNASERTTALEELFAVIRVEIEDLSCTSVPGALTALAEGQAITAAALREAANVHIFHIFLICTLGLSGRGRVAHVEHVNALHWSNVMSDLKKIKINLCENSNCQLLLTMPSP